jgi:prevent-host-death family protein
MVMSERTYTASRLKAELLGVLDGVAGTGEPVVVTKHGRPVARIVPIASELPLRGSVTFLVDDDELIRPLDESWDAETA